jgi:molybdenum cofactor cytidylyltransferase
MRSRPAIIVTAAGLGRRFGGAVHKLDQAFDGATVLVTTVRQAVQTQLPVVVVTTAGRAAALAGVLAPRDIIVLSDAEAARGMGASIATGVVERSGAAGWLVLPGDMPLVQSGTLLAVAGALDQHPVAYAQYRGRRGHPVAFAAELYSELIQLNSDDGARRVMLRYPAHGQDVEDPGVLLDIDTPADLDALRKAHAQVIKLKAEDV